MKMQESHKIIVAGVACMAILAMFVGVLVVKAGFIGKKTTEAVVVGLPEENLAITADTGEVLGEVTEKEYDNPLNNLYVNPFQN